MNLFSHALKDSSESQLWKLGSGYIVNIPSRTNANFTEDMIFNNLQNEREDTEKWARNNVVNQSTGQIITITEHTNS